MAKKAKKPLVQPTLSPWMLCIWRGEVERCYFGLVRLEVDGDVKGVQAMFVGSTGCVHHRHYPPTIRSQKGDKVVDTVSFAVPTLVKTTVGQMLDYFTRRLMLVGGDAAAYEALGVDKPLVEVVVTAVSPAKARELDDLYARAAKLLGVPDDELRERYSHLNRGLQAMNLRNRLRAKGHNV